MPPSHQEQSSEKTPSTHALVATQRPGSAYRVIEFTTQEHIDDIIALAVLFHAESSPHLNFEPAVIQYYADAIKADYDRENYNAYIAYREHEPVGFLVCKMVPYFFNRDRLAQQELWYVRPGYRGTRVAFDLIRAFEDWAKLRGAVEIWTGQANENANTGKKVSKVLAKIGYPRIGSYHRKVML